MMVMGVIALLTFLLADFTFETKLNKIKVYNQQDKIQARLNAESGLNFALAKLRMYQEGRNKIEKDESIKSAFPTSDLEAIIIQPFMYPIPAPKGAGIIQKTALEEFNKKTMFRGEVSVTFTKISGFLNPNGLRLKTTKPGTEQGKDAAFEEPDDDEEDKTPPSGAPADKKKGERADVIIEKKIAETLQRLLKDKSDVDEDFHSKYSNVDPAYLVKELKYYVNDSAQFNDSQKPEIESKFSQKNITPKHGPLASIDELYLLPSWDDALVDLIKDRMSVHEVNVISINELTIQDLKILFPSINDVQVEEFFKYRDGDPDKKIKANKFKNADDFKNVVVSTLNIVSDTEYQERMTELKQAGLTIDTAGKLYKVNSRGVFNNAVYNVIAYIDLPIKPTPQKPKVPGTPGGGTTPDEPGVTTPEGGKPPGEKEEKPQPVELLLPRVIEMRLE
jgi:type II secretory pathway component PulK